MIAADRNFYLVRALWRPRQHASAKQSRSQAVSYVMNPIAGGSLVVGRDYWESPPRHAAAAIAYATGAITISSPVTLQSSGHKGSLECRRDDLFMYLCRAWQC